MRFTQNFIEALSLWAKEFFDDCWDLRTWTSSTEGAYPVVTVRASQTDAWRALTGTASSGARRRCARRVRSRRHKRALVRSRELANI